MMLARARLLGLISLLALLAGCLPPPPPAVPTPTQGVSTPAAQPTAAPTPAAATPAPAPASPRPEATRPAGTPERTTDQEAARAATTRGELRAFWVDAFHAGFKSPDEVDQLLSAVRAANANAVIVQVRRRGDAYFTKGLEPRSEDPDLTPGFDALAYLIERAHNQQPRIEVHAWLATLPIWRSKQAGPVDPKHVFNLHGPETTGSANWITKDNKGNQFDGSNYALDPGHPAALDYTVDVYLDVVRRYDVDGIHMDYVRYADRTWGYNNVSVERFNRRYGRTGTPAPDDPLWSQWRRDQVTALVRRLYLEAVAIKPGLKVTAATIAWGDGPVTAADWARSAAVSRTFQDWRAWLEEGILDVAMPMAYFREASEKEQGWYDHWLEWTKNHRYNRQVTIGAGLFFNIPAENYEQIRRALVPSSTGERADGVTLYSFAQTSAQVPDIPSTDLRRNPRVTSDQVDRFHAGNAEFYRGLTARGQGGGTAPVFAERLPVPDMPWKSRPTSGHLMGTVRDTGGRPVDGALVTLAGPVERRLETDGTGFFGFVDLAPGRYTVTVSQAGRKLATAEADVQVGKVVETKVRS